MAEEAAFFGDVVPPKLRTPFILWYCFKNSFIPHLAKRDFLTCRLIYTVLALIVVLENYERPSKVGKVEDHASGSPEILTKVPSWGMIVDDKGELNVTEAQYTHADGLALPVLKDLQSLMDDSGHYTHLIITILVKHLDNKNVQKQPDMQLDIVKVTNSLTVITKVQMPMSLNGTEVLEKQWTSAWWSYH
ncbi:hypothetical protein POM88_046724 [Heracleum sosnowskyi]|uniref:Uncharacterized protein n=1 Tax=Heracleum sosnowskyi TaxID=360622 RepID=A0AAD8M4Y1_9APIA|nr:hypothetical protein POM88_046724 [Heracleum sosnowskyi]